MANPVGFNHPIAGVQHPDRAIDADRDRPAGGGRAGGDVQGEASHQRPAYWSERGLKELADSGLRDDLAAFYRQMAADLPASLAPARALQRLGADRR